MKTKTIAVLISVGVLMSPYSSLAMERNTRSGAGQHLNSLSILIAGVLSAVQYFLARQPQVLDRDDPYFFTTNSITLVSNSGMLFDVSFYDLEALILSAPEIGSQISNAIGSDMAYIQTQASSEALWLLTQMARSYFVLPDFLYKLTFDQIQALKREASALKSQKLRSLLVFFERNHFDIKTETKRKD